MAGGPEVPGKERPGFVPGNPRGDALRLVVVGRGRGRVHFDARAASWELAAGDIPRAIAGSAPGTPWVLCGGEPTLWADLPEAIGALASAGLGPVVATDGYSLADIRIARDLFLRGLRGVIVQLHAARPDAHDWVTGVNGSAKRAVAAIRSSRAVGLEVSGEAWVTKPTVAHLAETVSVFGRLGVKSVTVRRLTARQVKDAEVLGLLARLVPSVPWVAAAGRRASDLGMTLLADGFPDCLLDLCRGAGVRRPREQRAEFPGSSVPGLGPDGPGEVASCRTCAGRVACLGAPEDYVARFGGREFETLAARTRWTERT